MQLRQNNLINYNSFNYKLENRIKKVYMLDEKKLMNKQFSYK